MRLNVGNFGITGFNFENWRNTKTGWKKYSKSVIFIEIHLWNFLSSRPIKFLKRIHNFGVLSKAVINVNLCSYVDFVHFPLS